MDEVVDDPKHQTPNELFTSYKLYDTNFLITYDASNNFKIEVIYWLL